MRYEGLEGQNGRMASCTREKAEGTRKTKRQREAETRRLNEGAVRRFAKAIPTTIPTCFTTGVNIYIYIYIYTHTHTHTGGGAMEGQRETEQRRLNEGAVRRFAKAMPTTMPTCLTIGKQLRLRVKS